MSVNHHGPEDRGRNDLKLILQLFIQTYRIWWEFIWFSFPERIPTQFHILTSTVVVEIN